MQEVSCRVFGIVFDDLKRRRLDPSLLVQRTEIDLEYLRNKHGRIDWNDYVRIMDNLARVYEDTALEALGSAYFTGPLVAPFSLVARVLFDLQHFYGWLASGSAAAGNQMFSCISPAFEVRDRHHVIFTLTMADGYPPCRAFFLITRGALANVPRLFGLPPSEVEFSLTDRSGRYIITLPEHQSWLSRCRGALIRVFSAPKIARELEDTHGELVHKHRELEAAKQLIAQQARALETALHISQRVHATFDLERALEVVTEALVQLGGFRYARVELDSRVTRAQRSTTPGAPPAPSR